MAIDTDSAIFAVCALCISVGVLMLTLTQPARAIRLHLAFAVLLFGVAGMLVAARDVLPSWLAVVIADMAIGLSVVLMHRGFWLMFDRRPPDGLYGCMLAVLAIAYAVFVYPEAQLGPRLIVVSLFRMPFLLSAGVLLLPMRRAGRSISVLRWLLWLWTGWHALHVGLALSLGTPAVGTETLQGFSFIATTIGHVLVVGALLRMEAEQAVARATALAGELEAERDGLEEAVCQRTKELIRAKEDAERANTAKSHFLAAASHDLRQPLQALRLFIDYLRPGLEGTSHAGAIAHAAEALASTETLLHAMLDVSRLDAGTMPVDVTPVALDALFARLAAEAATIAQEKGIVLRVVPCREVIYSDRILLERAVRNLLVNAIRYTDAGRVLLGCRRDGGALRIEVWDSGLGIPSDKVKIIFDDFYQLGNAERDQRNGLGLGLGIVRRIVDLLGCQVAVQSWPGAGSVFSISVPATALKPSAVPAGALSAAPASP